MFVQVFHVHKITLFQLCALHEFTMSLNRSINQHSRKFEIVKINIVQAYFIIHEQSLLLSIKVHLIKICGKQIILEFGATKILGFIIKVLLIYSILIYDLKYCIILLWTFTGLTCDWLENN